MNIEVHPDKLRNSHQSVFIAVDLLMVGLIIINLSWLIFDSVFASSTVQALLSQWTPQFFEFYRDTLHADFILYDLVFICVFLAELIVRWGVAIINKTYHRWFFYPFIHWYDVLGCIPVGSFRFLRLLRLVSLLYRLQKHGIIDLSNSYPFQVVGKYFKILVEEVSDRVAVNVLEGVEDEIIHGAPVAHRITSEVLLPRKELLIDWVSQRLTELAETSYDSRSKEVRAYLDDLVANALRQNPGLSKFSTIPFMGSLALTTLERALGDLVYNILDEVVEDIKGEGSTDLIQEIIDVFVGSIVEPSSEFSGGIRDALLESLDLIKSEVKVQKWKLADLRSLDN